MAWTIETRIKKLMSLLGWQGLDNWTEISPEDSAQDVAEFLAWFDASLEHIPDDFVQGGWTITDALVAYYRKGESPADNVAYLQRERGRICLATLYHKERSEYERRKREPVRQFDY